MADSNPSDLVEMEEDEMTEPTSTTKASNSGPGQPQANTSAKLRKRTKTGCLTCRKRRIKCGEERPICNNCIKSKRQCEGYNPRVVWKPPIGDWANNTVAGTLQYHSGLLPGTRPAEDYNQLPNHGPYGTHAPIQPRPLIGPFDFANFDPSQPSYGPPNSGALGQSTTAPSYGHMRSNEGTYVPQPISTAARDPEAHPSSGQLHTPQVAAFPTETSHATQQHILGVAPISTDLPYHDMPNSQGHTYPQTPLSHVTSYTLSNQISPDHQQFASNQAAPAFLPTSFNEITHVSRPDASGNGSLHRASITSQQTINTHTFNDQPHHSIDQNSYPPHMSAFAPSIEEQRVQLLQRFDPTQGYSSDSFNQGFTQAGIRPSAEHVFGPKPTRSQIDTQALEAQLITTDFEQGQLSPNDVLNRAAVEYHDDEYYDVEEQDDIDIPAHEIERTNEKYDRDFSLMMDLYHKHTSDRAMRRMDAFIYAGMLDHYHAEWVANPLKNPHTARVFAHFIHASAPMLSIHERNPLNTQSMFKPGPVPGSQQSFWTYTMPMMALNNQGLLHSMLAIGSLHIARLQGASSTPSFKHYAYALKRIHNSVGHPKRRHQVTTLAASLLLAFYELMTADHLKWSSHLVGAKQLLIEIDYKGMTRQARAMKAQQAEFDKVYPWYDPGTMPPRPWQNVFRIDMPLPNEEILSTIIGKKLRYDDTGRVIEDFAENSNQEQPSIDMTKFELFQDLWWWYLRQDAYQSIISGNKLLMDYHHWGNCPPRAPIGRSDAVHATHDHIILMLGRIANFASNDRTRKIKVMKSQGGNWRPDPVLMGHMIGRTGGAGSPSAIGPPQGFGGLQPPRPPSFSRNTNPTYPMGPQIAASMSSMGAPGAFTSPHPPPTPQTPQAPSFAGPGGMPPSAPGSAQFPPASPQGPTFYGMAPSSSRVHMPSSYRGDRGASPDSKEDVELDPQEALHEALEEWQQINAALNVFASNLGPNFQPLSAEYHQPLATPFGDALQYRSYDIANIWAIYKMAKIITIRSHPAMPPAAMMAAAVAAPQTSLLANEIGRTAAGLVPPPSNVPLNPSLSAALISSTMPLFFAGVQYTDAAQRAWLVPRIRDIEERTGFASAGLIAQGCEIAWEKAGEAGRGPPYRATRRTGHRDDRLSGVGRIVPDPEEQNPMEHERPGFVPLRDHSGEKRLVPQRESRVQWAMGVLAEGKELREDKRTGT